MPRKPHTKKHPERNSRAHPGPRPGLLKEFLPGIRFVAITVSSLIAFFFLSHQPVIQERVIAPYTHFVAATSRVALRVLGVDAGGTGTLVASQEFSVSILNVCNGVEVTAILFAVILSFPATWRQKLIGLAIGYPAIFVINLARIIVLFFLGFKNPAIFDTVHYYYAQAFVILATLTIWLVWVSLYTSYGVKNDQTAAC